MPVPNELEYSGPNRDLVCEVMEFAFSDAIVSDAGRATDRGDVVITDDMVRAVDAASLMSDESRFIVGFGEHGILTPELWPYSDEISWSNEEGWTGLRGSLVAEYIQTTDWYDWKDKHEKEIKKCISLAVKWTADDSMHLHQHLRKMIPEGPAGPGGENGYYRDFIVNEVACDMMECCKNRAFNGRTDNFWERLFAVYRDGLWPCCWLGRWPADGKFLAWRRSS